MLLYVYEIEPLHYLQMLRGMIQNATYRIVRRLPWRLGSACRDESARLNSRARLNSENGGRIRTISRKGEGVRLLFLPTLTSGGKRARLEYPVAQVETVRLGGRKTVPGLPRCEVGRQYGR